MIYITLMIEFFKIGLFAVGGGPSTIPFLMDLIDKYHWFTKEEFTNLVAISESTPGPVGINLATYSGYLAGGIPGAIIATLSLVFPSVVIIIIIAKFLTNFSKNQTVQGVFYGLRPAVTGIITTSALGIIKIALLPQVNGHSVLQVKTFILFLVIFVFMQVKRLKKMHPGLWMLGAAILGLIIFRS